MTELFLQDVVVTVVAFAAACVVAWRVFSIVQPSKPPSCANCPSARAHARKPQQAADVETPGVVFVGDLRKSHRVS
jgi:hypothetical protein